MWRGSTAPVGHAVWRLHGLQLCEEVREVRLSKSLVPIVVPSVGPSSVVPLEVAHRDGAYVRALLGRLWLVELVVEGLVELVELGEQRAFAASLERSAISGAARRQRKPAALLPALTWIFARTSRGQRRPRTLLRHDGGRCRRGGRIDALAQRNVTLELFLRNLRGVRAARGRRRACCAGCAGTLRTPSLSPALAPPLACSLCDCALAHNLLRTEEGGARDATLPGGNNGKEGKE